MLQSNDSFHVLEPDAWPHEYDDQVAADVRISLQQMLQTQLEVLPIVRSFVRMTSG